MEFEPMLTPREKSPLPENVPRGGSNPRHRGQRAHALPTELLWPPSVYVTGNKTVSVCGTGNKAVRICNWQRGCACM